MFIREFKVVSKQKTMDVSLAGKINNEGNYLWISEKLDVIPFNS